MSGALLLGSDIGSGSCKTLLARDDGRVLARADAPYDLRYPQPGWAEYDPGDWYDAFCATVSAVLREVGVDARRIAAVCIVGITHDPVLLDAHGTVLRDAVHFNDQRCVGQVERLRDRWGGHVLERACNEVGTYWTWPQLLWIRENEPGVWSRTAGLLFPKDFVRWRLTGGPPNVTDHIDAAGTLLFDPRGSTWIDAFVDDLELARSVLPEVVDPFERVGAVCSAGARDTGLAEGTPVIAGTTDTAAEMLGMGALHAGQAMLKLASVGRIAFVSDRPTLHEHVLNYRHLIDGAWYPGTATKYAAQAFRWLRGALAPARAAHQRTPRGVAADCAAADGAPADAGLRGMPTYAEMDRWAADVPAGAQGMLFLPHLMGQSAPLWNPRLTASFLGIGFEHHLGHFVRAVLEGVAFGMRDALEAVRALGLDADEFFLVGNGAVSPLWRQIVADVVGRPLTVPRERDAAFGAVLMAGVAAGVLDPEPSSLRRWIGAEAYVEPHPERRETYDSLFGIYRRANAATAAVAGELYDLRR